MLVAISAETVKCQIVPVVTVALPWLRCRGCEHSSSKLSLLSQLSFSARVRNENSAFFKEVTGQVGARRILKEQKEAIYSSWLKWEFIV